jgi:hypothetical protein
MLKFDLRGDPKRIQEDDPTHVLNAVENLTCLGKEHGLANFLC